MCTDGFAALLSLIDGISGVTFGVDKIQNTETQE